MRAGSIRSCERTGFADRRRFGIKWRVSCPLTARRPLQISGFTGCRNPYGESSGHHQDRIGHARPKPAIAPKSEARAAKLTSIAESFNDVSGVFAYSSAALITLVWGREDRRRSERYYTFIRPDVIQRSDTGDDGFIGDQRAGKRKEKARNELTSGRGAAGDRIHWPSLLLRARDPNIQVSGRWEQCIQGDICRASVPAR